MYFDAELKVGDHIYLVERFSRSLISIHLSSGETKIEAYLPWKYMEAEISMLLWENNIFIYSPVIRDIFVYDCFSHKTRIIELQELEADETGFYHSNILIDCDEFIVLPFKGKVIKRYRINGELKSNDDQWYIAIGKEIKYNKNLSGNIRVNSACIVKEQLFFSLVYGNQNYLCKYELNKEEKSCGIIYGSGEIPIRGIYNYLNKILFRRLFPNKTKIVLIDLEPLKQKTITINYPTVFEEDIYMNNGYIIAPFRNKILELNENNINLNRKIYSFKSSDNYIANGVLFNTLENEILIVDADNIKKYSIKKIVQEIKDNVLYQDSYRNLFDKQLILERKYKIAHLINYMVEYSMIMEKKKQLLDDNSSLGGLVWKAIK